MSSSPITARRAWRRTDDHKPGTPKVELVTEPLPLPLSPTGILIKVHAVSLNYRDANIANGGNPWPVTPHGIPCNDAAGEIVSLGKQVRDFKIGDRVAPIVDTENLTGREAKRSWLAADEDGVLADYVVFDQTRLCRIPEHLSWVEAATVPSAGTTAWTSLLGVGIGKSVLLQGTGGVSMIALKLARAAGMKVIMTSSSEEKLKDVVEKFGKPDVLTINYNTTPNWHEKVLEMTDGVGVDCVVEIGGANSLVKSMKCTRRGGIVSSVGYLSKKNWDGLDEFISTLIDRRIVLRGINAGSKIDLEDLFAALAANQMHLDDIIDSVQPFDKSEEAIEQLWQGKVVGKLVLQL